MPPPVIIRNGGSGGGGGGGAMIAVVVMMFCILLSAIVGAGLYIFWEDLFPPGPGAPGAPGSTTTPSPDPYYSSPSQTDSSSPPGAPGSSPGGAPGSPPMAPGSLEMLEEHKLLFTLKRLSDNKTLDEWGWQTRMHPDGDYRWNYHHKGKEGGFLFSSKEGGNVALMNDKPDHPKEAKINPHRRHGSEDKPYWFFKLWTKEGWNYTGSEDRALKGYRITPTDDDGKTHCLSFDSDDGPAVWKDCVREEDNPEEFKKQIYVLRVGGGK